MENKKLETILYSGAGVLVMFIAIVAINVIGGAAKVRVDVTEDNIYTLSDGTKNILSKLDTPIEINFYATRNENFMPVQLKNYAKRVEDLLDEYRAHADGNIEIHKFNPEPDSDAEDKANLDGVSGQSLDAFGMDRIYLGLSVNMLDTKVALPFLNPDREKLLEYDLSRAISQVVNPEKGVVGVISSLPVMGMATNPMMAQMGQQGQEPWIFISELQRDFELRELGTSVEEIDPDVDVLMVIHPKNLSEATEYAIDQFLLRGGKVFAMLDPKAVSEPPPMGNNQLQAQMEPGSNLPRLLSAWGYSFDPGKVLADQAYKLQTRGQNGGVIDHLALLGLTESAINPDDIVTSQIDNLIFVLAGVFTGEPAEGLQQDTILYSSENSQLVEGFMAQMAPQQLLTDFASSDTEYPIALRLTGDFKTAFPDGKPVSITADEESEETPAEEESTSAHLTESQNAGVVFLVGDTDFAYDQFAARVQNFFGQRMITPQGGNLSFGQSIIEQLAGDSDLITVRSRATMQRPFTKISEMQKVAQEEYQGKIAELEEELRATEQRISDLQSVRQDQGQQFILSPEQQAELEKFREERVKVNQELKQMRRDFRKDIDALETKLKWVNIALMPFLVTIGGITLATVKRKRTAAK